MKWEFKHCHNDLIHENVTEFFGLTEKDVYLLECDGKQLAVFNSHELAKAICDYFNGG
jgi:hypothetical protein